MKRRVAILISGRGSNMAALIKAAAAAGFPGRDRGRDFQSRRCAGPGKSQGQRRSGGRRSKASRSARIAPRSRRRCKSALDSHQIDLICLGGFMRLFTADFVQRWYGRMLNIHPSLLPSFPGLDPHGQALRAGVKISGATVHFVIPETDAGPILMQGAVAVSRSRHAGDAGGARSSRSSTASIPMRCGCSPAAGSGSRVKSARPRQRRRRQFPDLAIA